MISSRTIRIGLALVVIGCAFLLPVVAATAISLYSENVALRHQLKASLGNSLDIANLPDGTYRRFDGDENFAVVVGPKEAAEQFNCRIMAVSSRSRIPARFTISGGNITEIHQPPRQEAPRSVNNLLVAN
jgi:hypothetical protein